MRVIVTGGAGFLGSHVADVLNERGHDVTVVDTAETQRHRYTPADLLDPGSLESAFRGSDAICHLAAIGDVYLAGDKPALAAQTNVTGSANVCEAALLAGVRSVICASTWEVYGAPQYQPLDEKHPTNPDHPYNITKLAGERLALAYGHLREGLRVVALRLGTAYGTRMRPNSVFSIFVQRAMRGQPITIQGTGQQGRQFTHARDIGLAFALAIEKAPNGAVYNTVSEENVTIAQLASYIAERIPTRIERAPARQADVPSALVSSVLIRNELGWRPQVPFRQGLDELVEVLRAIPV
jgi:UDP-glucose 4-epimerase